MKSHLHLSFRCFRCMFTIKHWNFFNQVFCKYYQNRGFFHKLITFWILNTTKKITINKDLQTLGFKATWICYSCISSVLEYIFNLALIQCFWSSLIAIQKKKSNLGSWKIKICYIWLLFTICSEDKAKLFLWNKNWTYIFHLNCNFTLENDWNIRSSNFDPK